MKRGQYHVIAKNCPGHHTCLLPCLSASKMHAETCAKHGIIVKKSHKTPCNIA